MTASMPPLPKHAIASLRVKRDWGGPIAISAALMVGAAVSAQTLAWTTQDDMRALTQSAVEAIQDASTITLAHQHVAIPGQALAQRHSGHQNF